MQFFKPNTSIKNAALRGNVIFWSITFFFSLSALWLHTFWNPTKIVEMTPAQKVLTSIHLRDLVICTLIQNWRRRHKSFKLITHFHIETLMIDFWIDSHGILFKIHKKMIQAIIDWKRVKNPLWRDLEKISTSKPGHNSSFLLELHFFSFNFRCSLWGLKTCFFLVRWLFGSGDCFSSWPTQCKYWMSR